MNLYDVGYGIVVAVGAPYWLVKPSARRKVLTAFRERMGRMPGRDGAAPCVMIHAVSVGEVNATRALVSLLQRHRPDLQCVISTTTETGFARARELYANVGNCGVIRYPLDFTRAVRRTLDAIRPNLVVLMELEVWPNFIVQCERRGIQVVLANGRLTEPSFRRYKLIRPIVARMLRRLSGLCVQDQTYASRFVELGAPPGRVLVTGSMKFDTAEITDRVPGSAELGMAMGLRPGLERIWVCGSTGPGEEEVILRVYRALLPRFSRLRLVLVPRHPPRFDEVAALIERHKFKVVRRSRHEPPPPPVWAIPPVVLGDTMGELRTFYGLADLVFVGRTLVDLGPRQHGSDMIEPAALARPVLVGPYTGNFAEAMRKLDAAAAVSIVKDEVELQQAVTELLTDPQSALQMGRRAVQVVSTEQGATARNAELILALLRLQHDRAGRAAG